MPAEMEQRQVAKLYEVFVDIAETAVKAVVEKHNEKRPTGRRPYVWLMPQSINIPLQKVIQRRLGLIKEAANYTFSLKRRLSVLAGYHTERRKVAGKILRSKNRAMHRLKAKTEQLQRRYEVLLKAEGKPIPHKGYIKPTRKGENLPAGSGIYFLWEEGMVVYVGMSINIRNRCNLQGHHRAAPKHLISWLPFPVKNLKFEEAYYIGIHRPKLNGAIN